MAKRVVEQGISVEWGRDRALVKSSRFGQFLLFPKGETEVLEERRKKDLRDWVRTIDRDEGFSWGRSEAKGWIGLAIY